MMRVGDVSRAFWTCRPISTEHVAGVHAPRAHLRLRVALVIGDCSGKLFLGRHVL